MSDDAYQRCMEQIRYRSKVMAAGALPVPPTSKDETMSVRDLGSLQSDLTSTMSGALSGFGGYLRCESCGMEAALGDPGRRVTTDGWPKHCGQTMRWWTERQIDAGEVPTLDA